MKADCASAGKTSSVSTTAEASAGKGKDTEVAQFVMGSAPKSDAGKTSGGSSTAAAATGDISISGDSTDSAGGAATTTKLPPFLRKSMRGSPSVWQEVIMALEKAVKQVGEDVYDIHARWKKMKEFREKQEERMEEKQKEKVEELNVAVETKAPIKIMEKLMEDTGPQALPKRHTM